MAPGAAAALVLLWPRGAQAFDLVTAKEHQDEQQALKQGVRSMPPKLAVDPARLPRIDLMAPADTDRLALPEQHLAVGRVVRRPDARDRSSSTASRLKCGTCASRWSSQTAA